MAKTIRSEVTSVVHSLPWLIAQDEGLFAEEGLTAEFVYAPQRGTWKSKAPEQKAQFTGLDASMGYADLMRAVFEGLAFAARDCYAAMGPLPQDIRLTGGGARSKALRLMFASALNAPVRSVEREEAGAAGAAMIAVVQ